MKKDDISLSTKRKLAQSLKKLMARKDFDKITVREILEDADVARPTFYYHFEDIYDLMKWMFDTELLSLLKKSEDCVTWDDGLLLVLQYVEENRRVCLCAYRSVGRDMLHQLFFQNTRAVMARFVDNLLLDIPAQPEDVSFITDFYTMAWVNVLIQWMLRPEGRSPEDIVALVDTAAHGDVEAALRRSTAKAGK